MNKQFKLTFSILLLTLLLVGFSSAHILDQHVSECKDSLDKAINSEIGQKISPYRDYFLMGCQIPDISVVYYFQKDNNANASWWEKIISLFQFNVGRAYRNTHNKQICIDAVAKATNNKELAVAYGICAHGIPQDGASHNLAVPLAIEKTGLPNSMIHSVEEIYAMQQTTTHDDFVDSRNTLSLAYDVMPYLERVFGGTEGLSNVNIPELVDFFVANTVPDSGYSLGFHSFFALPSWVYWFLVIMFLLSIASLGLITRRLLDKKYDILNVFMGIISLSILLFVSIVIYGLLTGTVWQMWESLSQYLFSPAMYFIGGLLIFLSFGIIFLFFKSKDKKKNIPNLLVALFLLILGLILMTFPTALHLGNEQKIYDLGVERTTNMLTQGITYLNTLPIDPVGYEALKAADAKGAGIRTTLIIILSTLFLIIVYFVFKKRKSKGS